MTISPKAALLAGLISLALLPGLPVGSQQMRLIPPEQARARVTTLTQEVRWFQSLDQAKAEAQRTGRMVLWVHMLGNMSGST